MHGLGRAGQAPELGAMERARRDALEKGRMSANRRIEAGIEPVTPSSSGRRRQEAPCRPGFRSIRSHRWAGA